MKTQLKQDAQTRLKKMSGQVVGLQKMVEQERYCVDILTQVVALRAALEAFGAIVVSAHIEDCVYGAESLEESADARLEEVRRTLNRFLR